MTGCTGCLCRNRSTTSDASSHPYEPLQTAELGMDSSQEIVILSDKHSQPVNLTLSPQGLVVVKRKPGSLHSLKLGNPHSTSTRLIPYLSLLSITLSPSHTTTTTTNAKNRGEEQHLTIQALVPSRKGDEKSKLKLWKLSGRIQPFNNLNEEAQPSDGNGTISGDVSKKRVEEWIRLGELRAYQGVKRDRKFHVIVNPIGGKGLAKKAWESSVKPVLDAAKVTYQLTYTGPKGSPSHAFKLGQSHDSSAFDALISISGDGIVHELLNGLAFHSSGKGGKALRESPIVHIPCGSGNALATSIVGNEKVGDWRYCTLVGLKGTEKKIDLSSVTQKGGKRTFSFLTQAFGLMADLDLGTEHLRFLGDFRFTLGYIQGALTRRRYPMKLTVLVENSSKREIARQYNGSLEHSSSTLVSDEEGGDEIPALKYGSPDEPLAVDIEQEMKQKRTLDHLPKDGELDGEGKWWTIDLLSDKKGVFFLYGGKMPWISKDVMLFPPATPCSGLLDLCLVSPMSPLEALTAMDSAETGSLYHHPSLLYLQTPAYRLSFPHFDSSRNGVKEGNEKEMGYVSIDGEKMNHEDFNVEVHKGLARVMVLEDRFMGSKPIEGV
ncbi:hypothetical protein JCM3765_001250 [Sporobolomyces pararoseus]